MMVDPLVLAVLAGIVFMGFVPMIVYTTILWWIDHWEREPWYLIAAAFIWGAIPSCMLACLANSTITAFLFESVLYEPQEAGLDELQREEAEAERVLEAQALGAVLVAPIVEETVKGIALLFLFLVFRHHIDTLLDGLVYGAAVGFGFASIENIVYFVRTFLGLGGDAHDPAVLVPLGLLIFFRAFLFGLMHAYFTGMTGLGFALARYRRRWYLKLLLPLLGLIFAMSLHGLHNLMATWAGTVSMQNEAYGLIALGVMALIQYFGIFWVFVLIAVSLVTQGRWVRHYLQEEVTLGVLTQSQADSARSVWQRFEHGFLFLGRVITPRHNRRRLHQLAARLAIKKHQLARMGEDRAVREEVDYLRRELSQMSRELVAKGDT